MHCVAYALLDRVRNGAQISLMPGGRKYCQSYIQEIRFGRSSKIGTSVHKWGRISSDLKT